MTPSDPQTGPAPRSAATFRAEAAPAGRDPFDSSNLQAQGFDASTAAFRTALAASRADPDLALAFQDRLAGETARFRAWADDHRRGGAGGCGWSGPPDPFEPQTPEAMLKRAAAVADRRRRWRATPGGRLAAALAQAEANAEAVQAALEEVRAAVDRDDGSAPDRTAQAAAAALRLQASALGLQAAAREASGPLEGPAERPEGLWRLTREICAPMARAARSPDRLHEGRDPWPPAS